MLDGDRSSFRNRGGTNISVGLVPKIALLESAQSADGKGEGKIEAITGPDVSGAETGTTIQAQLDTSAGEASTALTIIYSEYSETAEEEFIGVVKGAQEKLWNWLFTPTHLSPGKRMKIWRASGPGT